MSNGVKGTINKPREGVFGWMDGAVGDRSAESVKIVLDDDCEDVGDRLGSGDLSELRPLLPFLEGFRGLRQCASSSS